MDRGNPSTCRGWVPRGRGSWAPRGRGGNRGYYNGRGRGGNRGYYNGRGRGGWNTRARGGQTNSTGNAPFNQSTADSSQSPSDNQRILTDTFSVEPGPFRGWKLYHLQEGFQEGSTTVKKIQAMERYLKKNINTFSLSDVEEKRAFSIDLKSLNDDVEFMSEWDTFKGDLIGSPEHSISCLGLAMHQIIVTGLEAEFVDGLEGAAKDRLPPIELPLVRARVTNLEPVLQLKNLKAIYYGKLVSVRGTIIRVGNIKLLCTWMTFECTVCHGVQCVKQPEGTHTPPTSCATARCRGRSFTPLLQSPFTQTVNWQSIRLQEVSSDDQREGGRVPRTVECELTEDLLDCCMPGDIITLIGIVKVHKNEPSNKKNAPNMFLLYLEAVSVQNNKSSNAAGGLSIEFNTRDYYAIQEIHAEKALFWLLVNSLCPMIYGHEMVKAGLLLTLFGGTRHTADARSDPHILVVGDPGLGKSQLLQSCANVAPRGVYVCGNTSTSAGLTVTVTRETGGNYALEAGALVLADQGCCCIDEFDKMPNQHQALLEAMEQQSISIAKAGIIATLPARTSILAAANPVGGHYNRAKTVAENLRMGSPLLSRFDLVFILLDKPDPVLDGLLTDHVMALHTGVKKTNSPTSSVSSTLILEQSFSDQNISLNERLRPQPGVSVDPIPHQLLRKYIAYARKYVSPRLTPGAASVLQRFYLELRRKHQTLDCSPITTRQLKSLVRLTEARAKMELREEATEMDAMDVVEIMRYSLIDTLNDGCGGIDFSRSMNGSGMSSKNQAKKFIGAMQRRADAQCRSMFSVAEMKEVGQSAGIQVSNFSDFLATLNNQGFLLKKGPQLYQLLSVDY